MFVMDLVPQLLVNALITGSLYALASVGLSLTYGLLKILNFSHGHFLMLGAYLFFTGYEILLLGVVGASLFTLCSMCLLSIFFLTVFVRLF